MIVDSHRAGEGEAAAEIAAILTSAGSAATAPIRAQADQFRRDPFAAGCERARSGAALGVAGGGFREKRGSRRISRPA